MVVSDEKAFIRAILENPKDDAPRLVFADWLDEQGRLHRASTIKHQISFRKGEIGWTADVLNDVEREFLPPGDLSLTAFLFRRGFVAEVRLTCAEFMTHASDLFSKHPIEKVTLTDRKPVERLGHDHWVWQQETTFQDNWGSGPNPYYPVRYDIPDAVFDLMVNWNYSYGEGIGTYKTAPSEREACEIVSDACVLYGRKAAGLSA